MKTPKIVYIEWQDAAGTDSPWTVEVPSTAECKTIGFLMWRDKRQVTVAHSYGDGAAFGGCISIPTGCIKKVKVLTGGSK